MRIVAFDPGRLASWAVLDTNRSPLHDAVPGEVFLRNMTCALPEGVGQTYTWMPSGDEILVVVHTAQGGLEPGLIRVGPEGMRGYVARGSGYFGSTFFLQFLSCIGNISI